MIEYLANLYYMQTPPTILENSFKTYHVPGVTYINLHKEQDFRVKLYHIRAKIDSPLVSPHNHKYDFNTEVLYGEVRNCLFMEIDTKNQYSNCSRYTCGDSGEILPLTGEVCALLPNMYWPIYKAGQSYFMSKNNIHTIIPLTQDVVLLIREYKKQSDFSDVYMGEKNYSVNTKPVYEKFRDITEIDSHFQEIISLLKSQQK
jgi:hypothetical protein